MDRRGGADDFLPGGKDDLAAVVDDVKAFDMIDGTDAGQQFADVDDFAVPEEHGRWNDVAGDVGRKVELCRMQSPFAFAVDRHEGNRQERSPAGRVLGPGDRTDQPADLTGDQAAGVAAAR